jgi:hypothetical protein
MDNRDSGMLIGLLAIAGGLFYVGSELNKSRKGRESNPKFKDKKKNKKEDLDKRTIVGFRQAAQLK